MNLENLLAGQEPTEGAKLLTDLCEICPPNGGSFIWQFGEKAKSIGNDKQVSAKDAAMIFGLHGDEIGPLKALKILMPEIVEVQNELRAQVTIIIGNPLAVVLGTRGVDEGDANRLFGKKGNTLNHLRVREIEETILRAEPDVVNDYHCTRNPSKPFVFVPKGFGNYEDKLVQELVAAHGLGSVVLADYSKYTDSANEVDHWAIEMSRGKIRALTAEMGCLQDKSNAPDSLQSPVGLTINGVKNSLRVLNIFDFENDGKVVPWNEADKWDIFDGIYSGGGFKWNGKVENFGEFQTGEVYAYQNGKALCAQENFATMFVKNNGGFDPGNPLQRVALAMRRIQ